MQHKANTKTRTYECVFHNFPTWIKENSDADEIVFKGTMPEKEFCEINKFLDLFIGKTVDIADYDVDAEDPCEDCKGYNIEIEYTMDNYMEDFFYGMEDLFDHEEDLLFEKYWWHKTVVNKHFATRFVINEETITSEDGTVYIQNKSMERIVIPENVKIIGDYALARLKDVKEVVMPEELDEIGKCAFADIDQWASFFNNGTIDECNIILPKRLKRLGEWAFDCCNFKNLIIPEGIEEIPICCFSHCIIFDLTLPTTLKIIRQEGFDCFWGDSLIVPEGVTRIEYDSLNMHSFQTVHFPSTLAEIDKRFFYEYPVDEGNDIPYITVDENNPVFYAKDGTLYKKGEKKPYLRFKYKKRS